jgi:HEAT repeat protein
MSERFDLVELVIDLNNADKGTSGAAFEAVVSLGEQAVPHLVDMFPDIMGVARLSVIRAFGEIGDRRASGVLVEMIRSQDPHEYIFASSLAARALGQIGDIKALTGLLEDELSGPRRMAVTVLRNLKHPDSVEALGRAMYDNDAKVADIALIALQQIGTPHALALLDAHQAR